MTELESFRLRTQQVLDERLTEATDRYTAAVAQQARDVTDLSTRLMAQLGDVFGAHARNAQALNEVARGVTEAGNELTARVRAVEVPRDLLVRRADAVGQRFDRAGQRIGEAAEDLARRLGAVEVPSDWLRVRIEQLAASVEQATATIGKATLAERQRLQELDQGMAAVGDCAARLSDTVGTLAQSAAGLEASVGQLTAMPAALQPALDTAGRFRESVEAHATAVHNAAAAAVEDAEQIRSHHERLLSDLAATQGELGRGLGSVAEGAARFSATVGTLTQSAAELEKSIGRLSGLETALEPALAAAGQFREGVEAHAAAVRDVAAAAVEDAREVRAYRDGLVRVSEIAVSTDQAMTSVETR